MIGKIQIMDQKTNWGNPKSNSYDLAIHPICETEYHKYLQIWQIVQIKVPDQIHPSLLGGHRVYGNLITNLEQGLTDDSMVLFFICFYNKLQWYLIEQMSVVRSDQLTDGVFMYRLPDNQLAD